MKNILVVLFVLMIGIPSPLPPLPIPSRDRYVVWQEKERDCDYSRYNQICFGPDWNGDGVGDFCSKEGR